LSRVIDHPSLTPVFSSPPRKEIVVLTTYSLHPRRLPPVGRTIFRQPSTLLQCAQLALFDSSPFPCGCRAAGLVQSSECVRCREMIAPVLATAAGGYDEMSTAGLTAANAGIRDE